MKTLILFLITLNCFAGYRAQSKFHLNSAASYNNSKSCETIEGEVCVKESCGGESINLNYCILIDEVIDDVSSPIETKSEIETCTDIPTCDAILASKSCTDPWEIVKLTMYTEVYCSKITGYNTMLSGRKIVVVDEALKTTYDADQATKAVTKAAMDAQLKDMRDGKEIYAKIMLANKARLTTAQRATMRTNFALIRDYFLDGEICLAKTDVDAIVPDGIIIRQEDKDSTLTLIASYKTCI
jgi:hypothetical protein